MMDGDKFYPYLLRLKDYAGTTDDKLANATRPKASPHRDALGVLPFSQLEKAPGNQGEFLCEFLDSALNDPGGFGIPSCENVIQFLFRQFIARVFPQRVRSDFAHRGAPILDDVPKCALAGASAETPFVISEFNIVAVQIDGRQTFRTVSRDGGQGDLAGHAEFLACARST